MKYDADYFIAKFEAIPDNEWCVGDFEVDGRHCARGHCGERSEKETPESLALIEICNMMLGNGYQVAEVNDGDHPRYREHDSPKARVLALLRDAKEAGL